MALLLLATNVAPSAHGAIFSTNTTIEETNFTYEGQDIVVDRATLTINGPHRFRSLVLTNGARLTHTPCTADTTYKLDVTVTNLLRVTRDSSIDVQGRGYLPWRTTNNSTLNAASGNSGGSYGGRGGDLNGMANGTYGDPRFPDEWGSGGAGVGEPTAGGGLIWIRAGVLQLDQGSRVIADGGTTPNGCNGLGAAGGRGSGGGIFIAVETLVGSGTISAKGYGASHIPPKGAGGGGRIAIYAVDLSSFDTNGITAIGGGDCGPIGGGQSGTIHIRPGLLLFPGGSVPALGIHQGTNALATNQNDRTVGWAFRVERPVQVTHLGLLDAIGAGFVEPHSVSLWSANGVRLAQTNVPAGSSHIVDEGFRFVPIPVVGLVPGNYVIGAFYRSNSADLFPNEVSAISSASGIAFDGARASGEFRDTFPELSPGGRNYFGPNFRFIRKTSADLQVSQTVSTPFARPGEPITFSITVTNRGMDDSAGVILTSTIDNFSNIVAVARPGAAVTSERFVIADVGNIAPGASATVDIIVSPQLPGPLTVSSQVSAGTSDPDSLNNSSTTNVTVLGTRAGASWRFVSIPGLPAGTSAQSVWARTRDEAYLWAYRAATKTAYLYRWNGTMWQKVPGEEFSNVDAGWVFGAGDSAVFASCYEVSGSRGRVRQSQDNGQTFVEATLPSDATGSRPRNFGGTAGNVHFATERGQLVRFDGMAWSLIPDASQGIEAIHFVTPGVGLYVGCNERGSWNGSRWYSDGPESFCDVKATWATRNEQGLHWYAVGNNSFANGVRVWKYDADRRSFGTPFGTVFADGQAPNIGSAESVWGSNAEDVYVVGDLAAEPGGPRAGRVYHFDGRFWSAVSGLGTLPSAGSVHGTGPEDVWIALGDGRLLHNVAYAPPSVVATPPNAVASIGGSITFQAEVTGDGPFRYQWRRNGANIPGADESSLTITNVQIEDGGSYTVVVEGAGGVVTSDPPTILFVDRPMLLLSDAFSSRILLTGTTSSLIATQGNSGFTLESGEPLHAGKTNGASAWYTWTAPANGIATFNTVGSTFDTVLAVYMGNELTNLVEIASSDDAERFFTSKVAFNAQAGVAYQIAIAGYATYQGAIVLDYALETTEQTLPVFVQQPTGRTAVLGSSNTFMVSVQGTNLSYAWYRDGSPMFGQTSATLTLNPVQRMDVGAYTVRITNAFGRGVESLPALLEIGLVPLEFTRFFDKIEDALFVGQPLLLTERDDNPRAGLRAATFVPPGAGVIDTSNDGARTQARETNDCGVLGNATVHLTLTTTNKAIVRLDTEGSSIPTILAVYQSSRTGYVSWRCARSDPTNRFSEVVFESDEVTRDYRIKLDGLNGATGRIQLNYGIGAPPRIDLTRSGVSSIEADRLRISVVLTNFGPRINYFWTLNGIHQPSWTNATLELFGSLTDQIGEFSLVAFNAFGQSRFNFPLSHLELAGSTDLVIRRPRYLPFVLQSATNLQRLDWTQEFRLEAERIDRVATNLIFVETNRWSLRTNSSQFYFRGMIPSNSTVSMP